MAKKRLYLVDATAFCYRAFYALRGLSTSFGQPSGAVFGFTNMLNKILKEEDPEFFAACFDVSRDTFRQKKFAEYKIQRPPMPDELSSQMPLIKEVASACGIALLEKEGFEADDIIATIARNAKEQGLFTTIVTSDKDMLQLVDEDVVVFNPYEGKGIIYDSKRVLQRFGVSAKQVPDIIALMGDSADNIPGVPGIGDKTATALIGKFGTVEKIISDVGAIGQDRLKESIKDNIERIRLNKELVVLDSRINLDFNLEKFRVGKPNFKELFRLFKYLEFKSFLKGIESGADNANKSGAPKVNILGVDNLKSALAKDSELFLYLQGQNEVACYANEKFFLLDSQNTQTKDILADPKIKKIGHDLKRIKILLAKKEAVLGGLYFDTMLAAYLANPSKTDYSLAGAAWDYLEEAVNASSVDAQRALSLIIKLRPKLEEELREKSLSKLFTDVEMPLVDVLADMESNGIKLDSKVLQGLSKEIESRLIKLIEEIYALCGCQFNINSPKQLRDILFERLKLPVIKRTKTGPSTDEEVLKALASQHKLPALLVEYRQLTKLKNTYIDTLPQMVDPATGRIHASFNQAGTETGRLSSSNPNLQNIPIKTDIGRNIRRAIIAPGADTWLLACDYSQIELRILAHICQDENLVLAFNNDKDIHKNTAALIYGANEDDVTESMRELAKRINFGIIYGQSAYGLARDLNVSVKEAQDFIDGYFLRYPRVKEYIQEQIKKAKAEGFVSTILGRRRYIPEINNKNQGIRGFAERQAINTPIQGSASDLIKLAMVNIHNYIKEDNLRSKMIIQVHDELVFEVAGKEFAKFSSAVKDKMENVLKLSVPLKVTMKKGKNWLETDKQIAYEG